MATDRNNPNTTGLPAETNLSPHRACIRTTRSVSCPSFSPVIASYRNSSSPTFVRCLRTPNTPARAVALQARHAFVSKSRPNRWARTDTGLGFAGFDLVNKPPGLRLLHGTWEGVSRYSPDSAVGATGRARLGSIQLGVEYRCATRWRT